MSANRITLDLGESSVERIKRLLKVLEARTIVDVVRRALKLLEYHASLAQEGKEILLRDKTTGEVEKITILDLVPKAKDGGKL